ADADHHPTTSQEPSAPSASAPDCCQWPSPRPGPRTLRAGAPLRAPLRSETLSDSPSKCSCDVRPVKVKPESKYEYTFRSGLTLTHGQGPAWVGPDGHNPRRERFSFPAIFSQLLLDRTPLGFRKIAPVRTCLSCVPSAERTQRCVSTA